MRVQNAAEKLVAFLTTWYGSPPDYLCRSDSWLPSFIPEKVRNNINEFMIQNGIRYGRSHVSTLTSVAKMSDKRRHELSQTIEEAMFYGMPRSLSSAALRQDGVKPDADAERAIQNGDRTFTFED